MQSFLTFLTESKNLHLEHAEDEIFNFGADGISEVTNFLESLQDMLSGNAKSKVNVTVKWDGAPAVFAGTNPENGKFFVGTKSIFNKTPKLNYTPADIRKNHTKPELANKLIESLKYLSKIGIKGVLQGDLLYTTGDIKKATFDNESVLAFTPNTITYTVPTDSDLGKQISASKIGIIFHTSYSGKTMKDLKASFKVNVKSLRPSKDVWFDDASFKDTSGSALFTIKQNRSFSILMKDLKKQKVDSSFLNEFIGTSDYSLMVKTYNNVKIREGQAVSNPNAHVDGFISYYKTRKEDDIEKLKRQETKDNKQKILDSTIKYFTKNREKLIDIFKLYKAIAEAKVFLIRKLESVKDIGTFIKTGDGYEVTAPEGYVAVDKRGKAIKLVDRLEFSRSNFNAAKDWVKGGKK